MNMTKMMLGAGECRCQWLVLDPGKSTSDGSGLTTVGRDLHGEITCPPPPPALGMMALPYAFANLGLLLGAITLLLVAAMTLFSLTALVRCAHAARTTPHVHAAVAALAGLCPTSSLCVMHCARHDADGC